MPSHCLGNKDKPRLSKLTGFQLKVAEILNFDRSCIYRWLRQFGKGGYEALESKMPPGAEPIITAEADEWLKQTVLYFARLKFVDLAASRGMRCKAQIAPCGRSHTSNLQRSSAPARRWINAQILAVRSITGTPVEFGYDTNLWTCTILSEILEQKIGVKVSDCAVGLHLKAMGLTCQKPEYQDFKRNERKIEHFVKDIFPKVQRIAEKMGADIAFEDETGVGFMTRHGRTWGMSGKTPVVKVSTLRGGYNVLSAVTAQGDMSYSVKDCTVNVETFIEFLEELMLNTRPLILFVDHATFHRSKLVRDYVRAHRSQIRILFLPKRAPEFNPDEQVWNEVKNNHIGKQPVKNKADLKERLTIVLDSIKQNTKRIISFFNLPHTKKLSSNYFPSGTSLQHWCPLPFKGLILSHRHR